METRFQTSFIPKKTVPQRVGNGRPESVSVVMVVSVVIFLLTAASAGGVFAYKKILIERINSKNKQFVDAKNSFQPGFIEELNRLNKRIDSANTILAKHTAVSPIFDFLADTTLATVKFSKFSYGLDDLGDVSLSMTGLAKNFDAVALQSDLFGKEPRIKNPVFSDVNPDQKGNIAFKFSASLDPNFISYKSNLSALTPTEVTAAPPAEVAN
ncbi:MAG: hypothetical protein V4467_02495 [Patescibacteria group bacterium]